MKDRRFLKHHELETFSMVDEQGRAVEIREFGTDPVYIIRAEGRLVEVFKKEIMIQLRDYLANYDPYRLIPDFKTGGLVVHVEWDKEDIFLDYVSIKLSGRGIKMDHTNLLSLVLYLMRIKEDV